MKIHRSVILGLPLWTCALAAAGIHSTASPDPTDQLSDQFQTDTRSQYKTTGTVRWEKGMLTLQAASLSRPVVAGAVAEMTVKLGFPPVEIERSIRETYIRFEVEGRDQAEAVISRKRVGDKIESTVAIVARASNQPKVKVRQVPLTEPASGEWKVRYRYGLLEIFRGEESCASGYVNFVARPLVAVTLGQMPGTVHCQSFQLAVEAPAPPLTAEQRTLVDQAKTLAVRSEQLFAKEQYGEALPSHRQLLEIYKTMFGDEHPVTLECLNNLAVVLHRLGNHVEARPLYERALTLRQKVLGDKHPHTALSLQNLGLHLEARGEIMHARRYLEQALRVRQEVLGDEHPLTAESLQRLGNLLSGQGQYAAARPYLERTLTVFEKAHGDAHANTASALSQLGSVLFHLGDYSGARAAFERSVAAYEELHGDQHIHTANVRVWLANVLLEHGEYARASQILEKSLATHLRTSGPEHAQTASVHACLGSALKCQAKLQEARTHYESALQIRQKAHGSSHPDTASSFLDMGGLLEAEGNYQGARAFYERALAVYQKVQGDASLNTAKSHHSLGSLLYLRGDYAIARRHFERALIIRHKLLGAGHHETAITLNQMGLTLQAEGDFATAQSCYERALTVLAKVLGEKHPRTIKVIHNLGYLRNGQGDYAAAQPYLEQAFKLYQETCGEEDPSITSTLHQLALCLRALGDHERARHYLEMALDIRKKVWGEKHPETAISLHHLGYLLHLQGEFDAARPYYEKALQINQESFGEDESATATAAGTLGSLYISKGDFTAARPYLEQAFNTECKRAQDQSVSQSLGDVLAQINAVRSHRDPLLSALRSLPDVADSDAYSVVWRTRGLTSGSHSGRRDLANDPGQQAQRADFVDLAAALPPDMAVVDFIETVVFEPPGDGDGAFRATRQYDAFVLRKTERTPGYTLAWVHLGASEPIHQALDKWQQAMQAGDVSALLVDARTQTGAENPGQSLRRLVWERVEPHVVGCSTVLVIPDGAMARMPWAAISGNRPGSFLLEDYAIAAAGHGQQLLALLRRDSPRGDRVLLVDGAECSVEGRTIADLARDAYDVTLLEGKAASEQVLRERMPTCRYVHLHVDGYVADTHLHTGVGQGVLGSKGLLTGSASARGATRSGPNPLSLLGALLANAKLTNLAINATPRGRNDGVLSLHEVAGMDLADNELVVLSACGTGLGQAPTGEGIFGLQRAFGLAGARAVLGTDWKPDASATQALMLEFYRNLWVKKLGKLESLRQAQLAMMRRYDPIQKRLDEPSQQKSDTQRTSPFYWAAFTLWGDWR